MFEFIGRLFGGSKAGEKIIDGVSSAADKLFYTDEEKAEAGVKARSEGYAVYMAWLKSTTGSRIARRLIALITTGIWAMEHIGAVITAQFAVFAEDPGRWTAVSESLAGYAADNNSLVGVVLLFYFGGPAATDAARGLVTKWVSKTGNQ